MSFWACAQLVPRQERLATHCLGLAGFTVYAPGVREKRVIRGRLVELRVPLFLNYCFTWIELQWYAAGKAPGVVRLVMDGERPARVPDAVVDELRKRERGGLIELPKPPGLKRGDAIRVTHGPFKGLRGLYDGMKPRDRVVVLLRLLGGEPLVTLSKADIEADIEAV